MVISRRSLSKSMPGMVFTRRTEAAGPRTSRTVPFPSFSRAGTGTIGSPSGDTLPAALGATEAAGPLQRLQGLAQTLILDGQRVAEVGPREHGALGHQREHLLREAASWRGGELPHPPHTGPGGG